jgi:hypothetical protein
MRKKVIAITSILVGATLLGYHLYSERITTPDTTGENTRSMVRTGGSTVPPTTTRILPTSSMLTEAQVRDNELRQILSQRHVRPESEISLTVTKSSGNMLYGFVGLGCKEGVPYEENAGCSGLFYANKLSDGWRIIDGNGFSCNDVLNIGIKKDFDSFTSNCTQ